MNPLQEYQRKVVLCLDTVMKQANSALPKSDLWGYIAGYGKMPANPELFRNDEWEGDYFEKLVEDYIYEMYEELPKYLADFYSEVIRKIPYEDLGLKEEH